MTMRTRSYAPLAVRITKAFGSPSFTTMRLGGFDRFRLRVIIGRYFSSEDETSHDR
jgi:hypothetical protein